MLLLRFVPDICSTGNSHFSTGFICRIIPQLLFSSLFVLIFCIVSFQSVSAQQRGIGVVVKDRSGKSVAVYRNSYALVIGASKYTHGWPSLEGVAKEIIGVESALRNNGFNVTTVLNPDSKELSTAFENFIGEHGFDEDNRLLFFFSGHGFSRKNGKKGYLIPVDAPDPGDDKKQFLAKALSMSQILAWSRKIESKHALFVFDSCFSGTIFKSKALPAQPNHISYAISKPVRQYITAGSAGEEVPAKSVFTPHFIRAISGQGDLDKDGYVTGTELGLYLRKKVTSYNGGQHPQYGKIKDPDLDEGDFVFKVSKAVGNEDTFNKSQWYDWLEEMKHAFNKSSSDDRKNIPPNLKLDSWRHFYSSYQEDNPYSSEDDQMKRHAERRISHWKSILKNKSDFVTYHEVDGRKVKIIHHGGKKKKRKK